MTSVSKSARIAGLLYILASVVGVPSKGNRQPPGVFVVITLEKDCDRLGDGFLAGA